MDHFFNILSSKSSIDWCELNYVKSLFVAEFWNTVSGLALCTSSFIFYIYTKAPILRRPSASKHLVKANFILIIVGLGTILFHSTLLYIFQILDEIPMLFMALEYISIYNKIGYNNNLKNFWLSKYKWLITSTIITSYFIHHKLQSILFMSTFIYCVYLIFFQLQNLYYVTCHQNKDKLFIYNSLTAFLFITSLILHTVDNLFCNSITVKYNLHAWWHVGTSIALFICNHIYSIHLGLNIKFYTII